MTHVIKAVASAAAIGVAVLAASSSAAEARHGRNAAFAVGAAAGVVGGAIIAGSAYNNGYGYGYPTGYGYAPGYGYPQGYGYGYQAQPVYDPCDPYGCQGGYYPPPRYRAPARAYYGRPSVVYGDPYGQSAHDIALDRFQNRK